MAYCYAVVDCGTPILLSPFINNYNHNIEMEPGICCKKKKKDHLIQRTRDYSVAGLQVC